jgi:hypothetical protein
MVRIFFRLFYQNTIEKFSKGRQAEIDVDVRVVADAEVDEGSDEEG